MFAQPQYCMGLTGEHRIQYSPLTKMPLKSWKMSSTRSQQPRVKSLQKPLVEANIPFQIKIVKDHDMKERLCLEVERLRVSACIMGSRGFGAEKRSRKARLGSVSDYCVHHCDCPVVVVRMPEAEGLHAKIPRVEITSVPEEEEING